LNKSHSTWLLFNLNLNPNLNLSLAEAEGLFWIGLRGEDEAAQGQVDAFLVAQGVRDEDVEAVRKALAEDGECECLCRGQADEGVELKALRYGDDFCIPREAADFDYASPWFRGEWVTEEQLRERVESDGWDPDWNPDKRSVGWNWGSFRLF
jgi:hypothetical protein